MDIVHEKMVDACERLLRLTTGKNALTSTEELDAASEAIELLIQLEGWLKSDADTPPPHLEQESLALLQHRIKVLEHLAEVMVAFAERGLWPNQM